MTAASMESCRFAARRSPRGRFWSVVDVRTRLQRVRHPFHQSIHIKQGAQLANKVEPKSSKFWIQSSLESPKRQRMRCRWLPTIRTTPVGVRGPICIQKKCAIWTRWRPVPVKSVNFSRAPGIVVAVSLDPILPHR
jgi:hypothetical protein